MLREHTEAGGTVLRTRADRSCVFLEAGRCSVHSDRPFASRIYPLTWHVDGDGNETFGLLEGHPESVGVLGTSGTVDEYCQSQELQPHIEMVRRYIVVHDRLRRAIERMADPDEGDVLDLAARRSEVDQLDAGTLATGWLDVDAVVETYCKAKGREVPADVDAVIELHVAALSEWIETLGL